MIVSIFQSRQRRLTVILSISAVAFCAIIFLVFFEMATSLTEQEAANRVRLYLQSKVAQNHLATLREKGLQLPDVELATRWQAEIKRIDKLTFVSVKVKRLFLDILFAEWPAYVVRVVIREENRQSVTRFFWLESDGIDHETSRFVWWFSL